MSNQGGDRSAVGGSRSKSGDTSKERTSAEWVTLGISVAILLALVGLLTYDFISRGTEPPVIEVQPKLDEVSRQGDLYYLPVDITNNGDRVAENVEVELSLSTSEGEPESVQFQVQFLNGHETASETVVFRQDPAMGKLEHNAAFSVP